MITNALPGEPSSSYERLDAQIAWYDHKSRGAQSAFKTTKLIEIGCAALVPLFATSNGMVTGACGVIVVVIEALQQINQWQQNWITYRSTCEALRHEKYSYLGSSGVYDGLDPVAARKTLVDRVEALVSTEHAKWQSRQEFRFDGARPIEKKA